MFKFDAQARKAVLSNVFFDRQIAENPVSDSFIDALGFARSGSFLQGREPMARFARFCDVQAGDSQTGQAQESRPGDSWVQWSLQGESTVAGRYFLHITAQAAPVLECQRCLEPFVCTISADNQVEVVRSPDALAADDQDEADSVERIVGSKRFDVLGFVEDELILAMPYVPKHEVCPPKGVALAQQEDDAQRKAERQSPFAVLEQLKKN